MKAKNMVVAVVIAVIALAVIFIARPFKPAGAAKKAVPGVQEKAKKASVVPAKKVFAKGMGGLTVKVKNSKDKDANLRVKAFRSDSNDSSVFEAAFVSQRTQELSPGTYDIEVDTVPVKIFKNIKVSEGKETAKDLGAAFGAINVKALNSKKKEAYVPVKINYPNSNRVVAAATANRPFEIVPGIYDVEIATVPSQVKKNVKVEAGKETALDLGIISGAITIKTVDDANNAVRLTARIKNAGANTVAASGATNASIEVSPGMYDVEVISAPPQTKKDVKIAAGEETNIDFIVSPPAKPAAPAKKK